MRTCKKCGAEKELNAENFRPHGWTPGFRHTCCECETKYQRTERAKNPERYAATTRKWNQNNRGKVNATKRKWYHENLDKHNATRRKSMYGLSDEGFKALFAAQNEKCAICAFVFPGMQTGDRTLSPHVDHCHTTGKIRGLLCHECNNLLARAKDSLGVLQSAIRYLLKSE